MNKIDIVRQAYAALNRGDVDGFVKDFDPQVERVEFEGTPMAGTFRGFDDVKAHVAKGRATWAEGGCEPERFVVEGDNVVVSVQVRARLHDRTDWLEGRATDVFTFRGGKITHFRTFTDETEALKWAAR